MVQMVENWSDVVGTVVGVKDAADRPELVDVTIAADEVRAVDDWPNLLGERAGAELAVLVPRSAVSDDLEPGRAIECRVRRTRSGVFAHPDHVRTAAR